MSGAERLIRVLLVEDQRMLRDGLRTILDLEPDIEVVGEAEDGLRAVQLAESLKPDVVLMDLKMPRLDGVEATRRIVGSLQGSRVVVLTTYDHDDLVLDALRAGAIGYLLKDDPADEMIRAVRLAARGESLLQPVVAAKLLGAFVRQPRPEPPHPSLGPRLRADANDSAGHETSEPLSGREVEVLGLVAEGASNAQIARRLALAEGTVKNHISTIMDKLAASNRTQAVALARARGLLP